MGIAAYNRGSAAIRHQLDREARARRTRVRCGGKLHNGPGKRYVRCERCQHIDWEANEGDLCTEFVPERGN